MIQLHFILETGTEHSSLRDNILTWFNHNLTVSAPDKNSSNSFFSNFMCWVNLSVEWEEGINYNKLGNYKLFHHKKVEKYLSCRCWWSVGQPRMINYLNIVRHYHPLMSSLCHHFIITEPQEFIKQLGQFPSSSRKFCKHIMYHVTKIKWGSIDHQINYFACKAYYKIYNFIKLSVSDQCEVVCFMSGVRLGMRSSLVTVETVVTSIYQHQHIFTIFYNIWTNFVNQLSEPWNIFWKQIKFDEEKWWCIKL